MSQSDTDLESNEMLEEEQETEEQETEEQDTEEQEESEESEEETQGEQKKPAPQWVKDLRKEARQLRRENKRLKQSQSSAQADEGPKDPGNRPRLSDYDHDEEEHEKALDAWYQKKLAYDEQKKTTERKQADEQRQFQEKIDRYNEQKNAIGFDDFEDVENVVDSEFDNMQIGVLLTLSDNPAALKYAIGSDDDLLDRLSSISDPIKFAHEIGKLESGKKSMSRTRKASTKPERAVSNTASSGSYSNKLKQLEAEAERTGDRTALIQFKRQKQK